MKIVDAGSIELDKEAPVIVDAGSIELDKQDRPEANLSWRQGADPSVLDRVLSLFSDPEKEKARAVNAIVDAEALSIRPDVAYQHKSAIDKYYQIRPENSQRRQRVYDDIKRFNDMGGAEDEWQAVLWKNARQVPYQMQIAAGGIMRMFEENPEGVYAMLGVTPSEEDLKTFQLAAEAREKKIVRTLSDEVIASGAEKAEKLRPMVMPGSFKDTAGMATQSALTNLAFLAPGLWMGRGVTLAGMGSQAFGRSYLEQREGGSSPATAMAAGAVTGASEILTEFIPVGIYLKPRASFVRSLAAAELTEIPTETVNQIVNDVTDKVTIRPDMTVEDAIENIMTTIQVTALSTPGISGITYSANKALGRSLLRSDHADTFDQAKNAALMDGATPQEAVTAGIEAVRETPEGAEYIEQKVEELKRAASEYKAPESKQPFILGVSEDANGDVTSFTMADPVTGQTFDVPAQRSEDRDTLNVTPDMQAVNAKLQEIRSADETDAFLDRIIEGQEDIDEAAGQLFRDDIDEMGFVNDVFTEEDAKPETVLDRVKAINDRIGEKGSVDIGPLVDLGRSIWAEGHHSIETFIARAKELLADVWDKVQYHIQAAWKILNNERGSVNIKPVTTPKGTADIPAKDKPQAEAGFTKVFRGEYQGNKKGNYYSPDVEFARQFTQSGLDKEIIEGFIKNKDIYRPKEDVYAGDPDAIEGIVQEAKNNGFKAVELSEGDGQPKSIYVIDRSAVKSTKQYTELPNPSRPPEVGGQTLYSGVDPTQVISVLKSLTENLKEAWPHLEALGLKAYESGKATYSAWSAEMKSYLGDLWESFKGSMAQLWESVKAFNESLGERGSFSMEQIEDMKDVTEAYQSMTFNTYDKPAEQKTSDIKKQIRKSTGQAQPKNKMVTEYDALTEAFRKEARTARAAFSAGKKSEVEKSKEKMRWLMRRRESLKNVRDYFGLTDAEMMSATKRRNPALMDDAEFKQFLRNVELKAVELAETRQEKMALLKLIEEKRLKKVDNYRQALELPTFNDMTAQQLRDFAKLLEPFQEDDVFLTQRELETVDRTDLKGIKTLREARECLAKEAGVDVEELNKVHVEALDSFRWDSALRERDPFYDIMVSRMTEAYLGAELRAHDVESQVYELARKSEKSRDRSLVGRMIPQDDLIMAFLESPPDRKAAIVEQMTPEQIDYANYMQAYFADALNYLIATKSLERGRENYFVHIRRSFLENLKDGGLKNAISELFKTYQQDQIVFNILDDDTGNILPLEKFFQFSLQRTDTMDPTRNVTKAFLTYVNTFERKKMFDAIIPKLDIYAQALTPTRYTPRGLEIDRSLKTYVNKWINNKKGRKISFDSVLRQGGPIDVGIRALRTFTTILDLGLSPIVQAAAVIGEQVANTAMLGTRGMATGTARMRTDKGKRILKKYEAWVGRSIWEEFTAPGKEITERLSQALFAGFDLATKTANKQFLLASMTDQEFEAEEISTERLAQMRLDMGRFRVVPGTGSLVGSTSVGDAAMQYKKWAVPIARTLIADAETLIGNIRAGKPLDARAGRELMRFAYMSAAVFIVGSMAGADDDDRSVIGKAKARMYREAMTLMQGIDPTLWLATPRTLTWLYQTAQALKSMVLLETYKSGDKEGELKGDDKLKRQFVPGVVRSVASED